MYCGWQGIKLLQTRYIVARKEVQVMGDPLSQEEIDRLLNAAAGGDSEEASPEVAETQAQVSEPVAAEAATPEPAAVADEPVGVEMTAEAQSEMAQEASAPSQPQAAPGSVVDPPWQGAQTTQPFTVLESTPPPSGPGVFGAATSSSSVPQDIQFGSLPGAGTSGSQPRSIDMLLDVKLQLTVELGRKDLTVKEALHLGPGSVIELDRIAGEPVDLYVNGKLIARGEVVVIDENFGVRVTEVVSPAERIRRVA